MSVQRSEWLVERTFHVRTSRVWECSTWKWSFGLLHQPAHNRDASVVQPVTLAGAAIASTVHVGAAPCALRFPYLLSVDPAPLAASPATCRQSRSTFPISAARPFVGSFASNTNLELRTYPRRRQGGYGQIKPQSVLPLVMNVEI